MAAETCAQASRRLAEPVLGTAPHVSAWLLVEQPGPWGRSAPVDSRLDPQVAAALDEAAARVDGLRVQLLRRPAGRRSGPRSAFVCGLGREGPWLRRLTFDDPHRLLDIDLAAVAAGAAPPDTVGHPPVQLVCTNGARDRCCAENGRPLAGALAAPLDVWETTHVGGHRFAGNVVCLPEGIYYGRLDAHIAPAVLAAHVDGRLALDHLRGRAWLAPAAQAAEITLRRRHGLDGAGDVTVNGVQAEGATTLVRLSVQGRYVEVEVERRPSGHARPVSCGGAPEDPWLFDVRQR